MGNKALCGLNCGTAPKKNKHIDLDFSNQKPQFRDLNFIDIISSNASLEQLDVSSNAVSKLGKDFAAKKWPNLKVLNLEGNCFNKISVSEWENLTSLQHLNLTKNELMSLPIDINNLPKSLAHLLLSENEISKLPDSFVQLNNLRTLTLNRTKQTFTKT